MWLVGIEKEIFFLLGDVFVLVVGVSDESRQRSEWDNYIWSEWARLVEMGKELLDTTGLVLQHHHRQTLGTIYSLAQHRELGTEIMIRKFCEIQLSTPYIGTEHSSVLGRGLAFRRAHSDPCSDHRPLINLGMI